VLIGKDEGWRKYYVYRVYLNEKEFEVKCLYRRFEFRGILCRHVLYVLTRKKIKVVSSQYILDRWRKNMKRKHNFIQCTYGGIEDTPDTKRFDKLCNATPTGTYGRFAAYEILRRVAEFSTSIS
jgi:zinc finger SWIM domain-containing protein 3